MSHILSVFAMLWIHGYWTYVIVTDPYQMFGPTSSRLASSGEDFIFYLTHVHTASFWTFRYIKLLSSKGWGGKT